MANYKNVEYMVFNNSGMVTCKLWGCQDLALKRLEKYTYDGVVPDMSRYLISDCYVGVAKCNPKYFDQEKMKKQALENAIIERDISINNAVREFVYDINNMLNEIELYGIHEVPEINNETSSGE